jgi:hypothetical protein
LATARHIIAQSEEEYQLEIKKLKAQLSEAKLRSAESDEDEGLAEGLAKKSLYIAELEKLLVSKDLQIQQSKENISLSASKPTKIPVKSSRMTFGNNRENDINPRIKKLNNRILLLEDEKTVLNTDLTEIRSIVCDIFSRMFSVTAMMLSVKLYLPKLADWKKPSNLRFQAAMWKWNS